MVHFVFNIVKKGVNFLDGKIYEVLVKSMKNDDKSISEPPLDLFEAI